MTRNVTPMIGENPVYPGYAFVTEADTYLFEKFLKMMRGAK